MASSTSDLPLQYGIEIETTLAFHQSLLPKTYNGRDPYRRKLIKRLSAHQAIELSNATGTNPLTRATRPPGYQSWAIKTTGAELSTAGMSFFNRHGRRVSRDAEGAPYQGDELVRTYWNEPLEIVERLFQKARKSDDDDDDGRDNVPELKPNSWKDSRDNYAAWTVVNDQTLVGAPRRLLKQILQQRGLINSSDDDEDDDNNIDNADNWDSTGIEIVSPVLDVGQGGREIENVLHILSSRQDMVAPERSRHTIFESPFAGLHCHIGFSSYLDVYRTQWINEGWDPKGTKGDDSEKKDIMAAPPNLMPVLKNLVCIWVLFEPLILEFFPHQRRGLAGALSAGDLQSNRQYFFSQLDKSIKIEHDHDDDRSHKGALRPSSTDIHNAIFNDPSIKTPSDLQSLIQSPGNRNYLLNLTPISTTCSLGWKIWDVPTVEFRFHECTSDPAAVNNFVDLCAKIVQAAVAGPVLEQKILASCKNNKNTNTTNRTPLQPESLPSDVEEFLAILALSPSSKQYWRHRREQFCSSSILFPSSCHYHRIPQEHEQKNNPEHHRTELTTSQTKNPEHHRQGLDDLQLLLPQKPQKPPQNPQQTTTDFTPKSISIIPVDVPVEIPQEWIQPLSYHIPDEFAAPISKTKRKYYHTNHDDADADADNEDEDEDHDDHHSHNKQNKTKNNYTKSNYSEEDETVPSLSPPSSSSLSSVVSSRPPSPTESEMDRWEEQERLRLDMEFELEILKTKHTEHEHDHAKKRKKK